MELCTFGRSCIVRDLLFVYVDGVFVILIPQKWIGVDVIRFVLQVFVVADDAFPSTRLRQSGQAP